MTLGETIDRYANNVPSQLLSMTPESSSIPVRRFTFALENVIAQLNHRIPALTEKYVNACSYKFSAPQRHQIFWKHFRHLKTLIGKYNNTVLLKTLNDLHKRVSTSTARSYYYMPTDDALRYIAATYLSQIYTLKKLRDCCIRTAGMMIGYVEMGHWENLGLFILGLCADVFSAIPSQVKAISSAYDSIAEFVIAADASFPVSTAEIPAVANLKAANSTGKVDTERVLNLLKMTEEQMDAAKLQSEMAKIKEQLSKPKLDEFLDVSVDLGVTIERDELFSQGELTRVDPHSISVFNESQSVPKKKKLKKRKQIVSVDSAIDVLSTADAEETLAEEALVVVKKKNKKEKLKKQEDSIATELTMFDESATEVSLNGSQKNKLKRKLEQSEIFPVSSTPITKKKKRNLLDLSVSTINSEAEMTPVMPKKLKKIKRIANGETTTQVELSADSSVVSPVLKKKLKKLKKRAV